MEPSKPIINVSTYLREMAARQPYKRAVVYPVGRDHGGRVAYSHLTFRQLDRESDCLAHGMTNAGITRGVRTILMVKPSLEFFALVFAMFKVGAVPVVVDPGMGIKRMVSCLQEGKAKALIGIPPAHVLRKIYPKFFTSVDIWVTVGKKWFWSGLTFKQLRQTPWKKFSITDTGKDDIAAILFTTGSTGPAKGAVYTHGVFDAQLQAIRSNFDFSPDEIDLTTFPLFALFYPALGITSVIPDMDPTKPARVNPPKIIEAVVNHGVTNMFASPALLNRVGTYGKKHGVKLPSLKRVISAGAPVTADVIDLFSNMLMNDAQIHTGYGATEAMPVLLMGSREILSDTRHLSEKGFGVCVGRPVNTIDINIIKITDDQIADWTDDLPVEEGEIGELVVKGGLVTRRYFQKPRHDALAKIRDGEGFWHRMGDLGWMDNKGRYWFCGRKNHRVITRDKTLFTVPCEAVFNCHPSVFRTALVGIGTAPNQTPVICVELQAGHKRINKKAFLLEMKELADGNVLTENIKHFLIHPAFPVDIRHNSKIFREQLAEWAGKKLNR
ncbi:MAG: AMP-binding protein [Desulfobacteraceae bacterium]|nr:AMP-binding protein [Desulfobacteraceae bacterium]